MLGKNAKAISLCNSKESRAQPTPTLGHRNKGGFCHLSEIRVNWLSGALRGMPFPPPLPPHHLRKPPVGEMGALVPKKTRETQEETPGPGMAKALPHLAAGDPERTFWNLARHPWEGLLSARALRSESGGQVFSSTPGPLDAQGSAVQLDAASCALSAPGSNGSLF